MIFNFFTILKIIKIRILELWQRRIMLAIQAASAPTCSTNFISVWPGLKVGPGLPGRRPGTDLFGIYLPGLYRVACFYSFSAHDYSNFTD